MFLLIPISILLDLAATVIAVLFVNWWAPLFAYDGEVMDRGVATKGPRLPEWLAWFDTFDGTLDAGLQPGETSSYWTRMRWLYRNPAYGFSYWALGARFIPGEWWVERCDSDTFHATSQDGRFNWNVVRFGLRIKLGWKAWNYFQAWDKSWDTRPWGPEMRVPFVFSISLAK